MEIQWSLLLFSLLAGTGGSLLAFVGLSDLMGYGKKARRNLLAVALVLIVVGGLCSVLHLEQKANIMAAAANVFSFSPISMELIMVGVSFIVGACYLVAVVKEASEGAFKALGILGIIAGLLLGYVTGSGYQMGAQPNWDTVLLPLAYLGTDLAAGGTLYLALAAAMGDAEGIGKAPLATVLGAAVLSLALCLAYGASAGMGLEPALFAAGVLGAAVVCALLMAYVVAKGLSPAVAGGACAFALCAGVCLRAFMWLIGTGTLDFFSAAAGHLVL